MRKNEKRIILILLVFLIIAIVIFVVNKNQNYNNEEENIVQENGVIEEVPEEEIVEEFVQILEDGTKVNTSTKLSEAKEVNGIKFENIKLIQQNEQTLLTADVTNNSGSDINLTLVDIILIDKDENEIVTLGGLISQMQVGEKTQFTTSATLDYANAYDFKVEIK